MIKLFFLILIIFSSTTFANDRLKGYQALEDQDYKKALYYLSYEANLGDDKAQYNLGIMYKKGLGVPVNNNEAFSWFFLSLCIVLLSICRKKYIFLRLHFFDVL